MTDEHIFSYLLGELPEEESERFEEEGSAREDWPEEVRLAEHELVDAYLRDELTPEQRRHFEQNYLITEARLKRVAMAAALIRHVNPTPAPTPTEPTWIKSFIAFWGARSWALRAGLAVGAVAVVVGAVWLVRSRATHPQVFATLTLNINVNDDRAEGAQAGRVKLTRNTDALRIYLKLPGQPAAAGYRVELVNEDGETSPLTVAGRDAESVSVEIPSSHLASGEYALRLFAVRPDGTEQRVSGVYLFTVIVE
jgi:hypothetical protein